jgi:hypothetical protein
MTTDTGSSIASNGFGLPAKMRKSILFTGLFFQPLAVIAVKRCT